MREKAGVLLSHHEERSARELAFLMSILCGTCTRISGALER